MIEVELTKGQVAFLDDCDAEVAEVSWYAYFCSTYGNGGAYRAHRRPRVKGDYKSKLSLLMHRVVMERILSRKLDKTEEVDHKDLNPLNNQRENLRLATRGQNGSNRRMPSNNTSGYKGVGFDKRRNKWHANIVSKHKNKFLGYFSDPVEAALVYDKAARELHGEFAVVNFEVAQDGV